MSFLRRSTTAPPSSRTRDQARRLVIEQLERREVFSAVALKFTNASPEGWQIRDSQVTGKLAQSSQVQYTANLSVGQPIAFSFLSPDSTLTASLIDPNGTVVRVSEALINRQTFINPISASVAGTWSIVLAAPAGKTINYSLDVVLNASLEGRDSNEISPRTLGNTGWTLPSGERRYAFLGTSSPIQGGDVDAVLIDLKKSVGSVSIQLVGRDGQNLSGQTLELIDSSGVVRAIASPKVGNPSTLEIPNYLVPSNDRYTLRFTSSVAGGYGIVVVEGTLSKKIAASAILNELVNQRLVTPTSVNALLNTLSFDRVYQSLSSEQLMQVLVENKMVSGIGDAATLRATLASTRSLDLDHLRPDGILTALATMDGGSRLRQSSLIVDARNVKARLETLFATNKLTFLNTFTIEGLVRLFDNSISSAAGVKIDPIRAFSDKPVAPGASHVVVMHQLWINDMLKPDISGVATAALKATSAQPVGSRAVFLQRFLEMPGFAGGVVSGAGYIDPVNASGAKTTNYLVWMDQWTIQAKDRLGTVLREYKQLGGALDLLAIDIEDTMLSYYSLRAVDRRLDSAKPASVTVWQEILADSRWPELKAQLIARGIPEADLALSKIGTWDIQGDNAARWNAVMAERMSGYLNAAITDTVLALYPNATISNYGDNYHVQTVAARSFTGYKNSYYSLGALVGNAQSQSTYGDVRSVTIPGATFTPSSQFELRIATASFQQSTNSSGNPLPRGTATITLFEPVSSLKVGDRIIIENRGIDWIAPQYAGQFQISSISADGLTIKYTINLDSTQPLKSFDLKYRSRTDLTAWVVFDRSYERFVSELKAIRSQVAASDTPVLPWFSNPDYREAINTFAWDHYAEAIFHAALNGADDILWWKLGFETQPENTKIVNDILKELNPLIGYSGRQTISFDDPSWEDGYVMTGMEVNGKRVYRFTPDPHVQTTVLSSSGTVRIRVGNTTVEIPNASIYTPPSSSSALGMWIVQTKGTTALNGSPEQVLQSLTQSLTPLGVAPSAGVVGSTIRFNISTNDALVPLGTLLSFDIDWNGNGRIDSYQGTGQLNVGATYNSVGNRVVKVHTTIVGTGEKLPSIEIPVRVLAPGFNVETSTSDSGVKNLIYAGTNGNDYVIFESPSPGVIEAFVRENGTTTKHVFQGVTGGLYAYGLGGDDTLIARGVTMSVSLYGGDGNDTLIGGKGVSLIQGEAGNDFVIGGTGMNLLNGGTGVNTIQLNGNANWVAQNSGSVIGLQSHTAMQSYILPAIFQIVSAARIAAAMTPAGSDTQVAAAGLPLPPLAIQSASAVHATALDALFDDDDDRFASTLD